MPISYVAISAYARDHDIVGKEFGDFLRIIHKLDEIYLQFEAKRTKESEAGEAEPN
ncbi:hypothetical protein LJR221_001431 [Agrobacterium tumefaciens]